MPLVADNSPVANLLPQMLEPVRLGMIGAQQSTQNQQQQRDYVNAQMQQALANMHTERDFAFRQEQADRQFELAEQGQQLREQGFEHGVEMDEKAWEREKEQDSLLWKWRNEGMQLEQEVERRLREQFEAEQKRLENADKMKVAAQGAMLADFQTTALRLSQSGIDPTPFIQQFSHDPEGALKGIRQVAVKFDDEVRKQAVLQRQSQILMDFATGVAPQAEQRAQGIVDLVSIGAITPAQGFQQIADLHDPDTTIKQVVRTPIGTTAEIIIPGRIKGVGRPIEEFDEDISIEWMNIAAEAMGEFQAWIPDESGEAIRFTQAGIGDIIAKRKSGERPPLVEMKALHRWEQHLEEIKNFSLRLARDVGGWDFGGQAQPAAPPPSMNGQANPSAPTKPQQVRQFRKPDGSSIQLSDEQIQQIADRMGISFDEALKQLQGSASE